MRSHCLSRRTRLLANVHPPVHRALISSTQALRYPRKDHPTQLANPRLFKRSSSSVTPPADPEPPAPPTPSPSEPPSDPPPEDVEEKPKRRTRASTSKDTSKDTDASPELPSGLNILWTSESDPVDPSSSTSAKNALPPPEIFDELLHHLHITLHPQTQHRATYVSTNGPLVEPTFALYCPIEGGDFYIDQTVRELARRTRADVVVLDAVQLAAGESGHFGKAGSVLQIPNNPLHFPSPLTSSTSNSRSITFNEDDEFDDSPQFIPTQRIALHVLTPANLRSRGLFASPPRGSTIAKLKGFFDNLVAISPESKDGSSKSSSSSRTRRPRIVYVRDFPTLAASSSTWYPALLTAVRQRRQGATSRPSSPVVNPMTIIFGITPSFIAPSAASSSSGPGRSLINLLTSRFTGSSNSKLFDQSSKSDYGEDSFGDKGRERRILTRLKKWARGDVSSQDVPQLSITSEEAEELSGKPRSGNIVVVGGQDSLPGLPNVFSSALSGISSSSFGSSSHGSSDSDGKSQFFRTSIVMPALRSLSQEKTTRMARRREINELTMRMGIATIGGELPKWEYKTDVALPMPTEEHATTIEKESAMWEEWGRTVQVWSVVRRIADCAVGSVIATQSSRVSSKASLEPTPIPWTAVCEAWASMRSTQDMWKAMLSDASGKILRESEEDEETKEAEEEPKVDEVVERVKEDPDLDQHEHRLLGCIVDTASLTTTFSQVHLPPHTIDSVRTIVSLPLLYPNAFQHGILKEHSMTGCLLFGPPGTGKTLVVRALAKEAGCRVLAISPSDVMDMYVGEGEKLVKSVFTLARRLSPCVVFIDELDALFGARVSRETGGGIAHRGVITEFMQEMDGLKSSKEDNVIVIGATNRPFDLDDAVLRRLPRRLLVDLPGVKEREEILKILLRDETLDVDVDLKTLAKQTESFSGSDLKHLCVSAALDAVKERVNIPWRHTPSQSPDSASSAAHAEPTASTFSTTATASALPTASDTVTASSELATSSEAAKQSESPSDSPSIEEAPSAFHNRMISVRNFEKALKEITPSASESLGSLAELRKWNDEFGEGRRERKRQVWGKGRFGFTIDASESKDKENASGKEKKVQPAAASRDS